MKRLDPWMPKQLNMVSADAQKIYDAKEQEEAVEEQILHHLVCTAADFSALRCYKVKFEHCHFIDCQFTRGEFKDMIFQSCNFSNCDFSDSFFERVHIISSKAIGSKFCGASLKHVLIQDSNFDYTNFDAARWEWGAVLTTEMKHANMTQCRCREMEWSQVKLADTSFFKTSLRNMDFCSCEIHNLVLSDDLSELRGLTVDLYQAAQLATRLGLKIKD